MTGPRGSVRWRSRMRRSTAATSAGSRPDSPSRCMRASRAAARTRPGPCRRMSRSTVTAWGAFSISRRISQRRWKSCSTDKSASKSCTSPAIRAPYGTRDRAGGSVLEHPGVGGRWGVGDAVGVEYVSRVPRPPLDGLIDDIYYLEGASPYARLLLPPMPAALLIVNLGAPFRIRAGAGIETAEYADGCVVTVPTRAWEFGYPLRTRSVGVH